MERLRGEIPHRSTVTPPTADTPPATAKPLRERSFLIMKSEGTTSVVWVDDAGSCDRPGVHERDEDGLKDVRLWHRYVAPGPPAKKPTVRFLVYRCPKTLTWNEQKRVFRDEPPGAWRQLVADVNG